MAGGVDFATLGIRVQVEGDAQAARGLEGLAAAGAKTEMSLTRTATALRALNGMLQVLIASRAAREMDQLVVAIGKQGLVGALEDATAKLPLLGLATRRASEAWAAHTRAVEDSTKAVQDFVNAAQFGGEFAILRHIANLQAKLELLKETIGDASFKDLPKKLAEMHKLADLIRDAETVRGNEEAARVLEEQARALEEKARAAEKVTRAFEEQARAAEKARDATAQYLANLQLIWSAGAWGGSFGNANVQGPQSNVRLTNRMLVPNQLTPIVPDRRGQGGGATDNSIGGGGGFGRWGGIAMGVGGMALGMGLAGNGAVASGLGGALQFGAMGAQIAGPIGFVVGAVGGLVAGIIGHGKRAREEAEKLKQAQRQFDLTVAARGAAAGGDLAYAEALKRQIQNEKELNEARTAGLSKASIAMLQHVQALEAMAESTARATEAEKKRKEEIEATRRATEDLLIRGLSATGQGGFAARAGVVVGQQRERGAAVAAGASAGDLALLDMIHAYEFAAFSLNERVRAQTDAIEKAANEQLAVLGDQQRTAQEALRVAQDQLRQQEQTVNALRSVVASLTGYGSELRTGPMTTLAPHAALEAARAEFEALTNLAYGNLDTRAASAIPGAANRLLGLSRSYNASGQGYVTDFARVEFVIATLTERFGTQLSVEERTLTELQTQTGKLQTQINETQRQMDVIRTEADKQIAAVNAYAEAERVRWRDEWSKWLEQNGYLRSMMQTLQGFELNDTIWGPGGPRGRRFDEDGRPLPGTTDFTSSTIKSAVNAPVRATEVGFGATVERLDRVESAIYTMRDDLRIAFERGGNE